jgi:hypothetical protein
MTVGDSIFLSAVLLSVVGLYAATKDRWNWKQLAKWIIGLPVVLLVLGGLGMWGYVEHRDRPVAQTSFEGFTLGTTAEIRLNKGAPSQVLGDTVWVYYVSDAKKAAYAVRFNSDRVRYVMYSAVREPDFHPFLHGFTINSTYEEVVKKLGTPGHSAISQDGLQRMVSYPQYNTFYSLEQAKVVDFGIYDRSTGPMEYLSAPAPATSAPQKDPKKL